MDREPLQLPKTIMMHKVGLALEGLSAPSEAWRMTGQEGVQRRGLYIIILLCDQVLKIKGMNFLKRR